MRQKLTLTFMIAVVALAFTIAARHSVAVPGPSHVEKPRSFSVGVYCIFLGRNRDECHAEPEGGTAPYTYQWSPTPLSGGGSSGIAVIGCPGTAIQTISVTVTDANGDTGSFSGQFQCCGSCPPQ
jgi:hypothetical protein